MILPKTLTPNESERVTKILSNPISFVDNPAFHKSDSYHSLFTSTVDLVDAETTWNGILANIVSNFDVFAHRHEKHLLTQAEEKVLFLQYNYAKFRVSQVQQKQSLEKADVYTLLYWWDISLAARSKIVVANLGLVIDMARKKYVLQRPDMPDFLSSGIYSLFRATESFDISLGWKFCTYACRGILQAFGNEKYNVYRGWNFEKKDLGTKETYNCNILSYTSESVNDYEDKHFNLADPKSLDWVENADLFDEIHHILTYNKAYLNANENFIIRHRFGIAEECDGIAMTLEEIGDLMSLSKERIRQIERRGLKKLKNYMLEHSCLV